MGKSDQIAGKEDEKVGKTDKVLTWVLTCVMLVFCLFLGWYIPSRGELDFQLADIELSLETSYGREKKQQFEYDEVTAELPLTRAELAETQPLADEAEAAVTALKEERKALRAEKKALEEARKEKENSGENAEKSVKTTEKSGEGSHE